jgi:hypothetical protein
MYRNIRDVLDSAGISLSLY